MPLFTIQPHDLLFFGDGRPMEPGVGSGGHGAHWPAPSIVFDAIHAALWRAHPKVQHWEFKHRLGRSRYRADPAKVASSKRFGTLATVGPFPVYQDLWLFPCPQDVTLEVDDREDVPEIDRLSDKVRLMTFLKEAETLSNLPEPLKQSLGSRTKPNKREPAAWWTREAFETYLAGTLDGQAVSTKHMMGAERLFSGEWTTGIGIHPDTQVQDEVNIYSAEYLRLRDGIALGIHATLATRDGEGINHLWNGTGSVIVGGQQRACHVERCPNEHDLSLVLPRGASISGKCVKWVLLSPAVFPAITAGTDTEGRPIEAHPGGWLPNWIHPQSGQVMLKRGDTARLPSDQTRLAWRQRIRQFAPFSATTKLIAARIPKPQVLTGWSDSFHLDHQDEGEDGKGSGKGAKPTLLAVPAGAVYYFECGSDEEARDLAAALNWHGQPDGTTVINRRSTLLGEKGFGLGVCGSWTEHSPL